MAVDSAVPPLTLANDEEKVLAHLRALLPLLADLSRADVMIALRENGVVRLCSHARPHSIAPAYEKSLVGETMTHESEPGVFEALDAGRSSRRIRDIPSEGAPGISAKA